MLMLTIDLFTKFTKKNMKHILYIILLTSGLVKSQIVYQTISHNTENLWINNNEPTVLTSNNNVAISGQLLSATSFVVRPTASYSIIIKPTIFINLTTKTQSTSEPTRIGKSGTTGKITIAPNPVADLLHVIIEDSQMTGYQIISLNNGKTYLENDSVPSANLYDINVASLPAGNYVLKAYTKSRQTLSANFIKL